MIDARQLINHSNPAAFGVEWTNGDNGNRFQLVNPRGTRSLTLSMKAPERDQWSTTHVVDPSRFGLADPPKTFAEFRAIALAYINAE